MKLNKILLIVFIFVMSQSCFSQDVPPPDTIEVNGKIFERVEVEASYSGGIDAWRNFLQKTLKPEVPTDNSAPIGKYTVIVQFIVMKDGTIGDLMPLTNHGYGMEQEVIRTLKLSGQWTPAMQNGRMVKAYRKQPITFQVEDDDISISTKVPFVLFTNTENTLSVEVNKVKPEDLQLSISQGTITNMGNGQFVVKLSKPGRVIIRLHVAIHHVASPDFLTALRTRSSRWRTS